MYVKISCALLILIFSWTSPLIESIHTHSAVITTARSSLTEPLVSPGSRQGDLALGYLAEEMDKYHRTFDVYTDADAVNNHFFDRARISSPGNEDAVLPMVEDSIDSPHSGNTCIKAQFQARRNNWGGWYFMNGVLQPGDSKPTSNWGDHPNAGVDLTGATRLTFFARGTTGNERVEFFAMGVGWDPDRGIRTMPYPDRSPKQSTGLVTLYQDWHQYTIYLTGLDISYVLGGFGWVAAADSNNNRDIAFFIDDVQYDKSTLDQPRLIPTFETLSPGLDLDRVVKGVAFLYDNAVAEIAFLAAGQVDRAGFIAKAIVYAQRYDDSYNDGRLRNAYWGGDLVVPPGWTPNGVAGAVRAPGYVNSQGDFIEDEYQQSVHAGNMAWAIIALLEFQKIDPSDGEYLMAARALGDWIIKNCWDDNSRGGFTVGFDGFPTNLRKATRKTTEHNAATAAAMRELYQFTGVADYLNAEAHAQLFLANVHDDQGGRYWFGTGDDGDSLVASTIPVNAQVLPLFASDGESLRDTRSLAYAETHNRMAAGGYDYNQDLDGVWFEGTCLMAIAYANTCQRQMFNSNMAFLKSSQMPNGSLPQADRDGVTTGLLQSGGPWLLYRRAHAGATAWFVLADREIQPLSGSTAASPLIESITVSKKELLLFGTRFCDISSVLINDTEKMQFVTDHNATFIQLNGKAKKLGLQSGANTIRIVDASGLASNTFSFNY